MFGDINRKLADLTDEELVGDVWKRGELSPRDRSVITGAGVVASYRTNELRGRTGRALGNGVTETGPIEMSTYLAFHPGWRCAATATGTTRDVLADRQD